MSDKKRFCSLVECFAQARHGDAYCDKHAAANAAADAAWLIRWPHHEPFGDGPETWRVGRKLGRTLYRQTGSQPSDQDTLIGIMDTPQLAQQVIDAINRQAAT